MKTDLALSWCPDEGSVKLTSAPYLGLVLVVLDENSDVLDFGEGDGDY